MQEQQNNSDVLANLTENTLNTIRNMRNTSENIKNRIGKQHNKIPNLILAVFTTHTWREKYVMQISTFSASSFIPWKR